MAFFDQAHLGWAMILGPAILVAAALKLDNRYLGPYFAVVDVVFNDFGTGYHWHDKEIIWSLLRRVGYIIAAGAILNGCSYKLSDALGVFLVAGFLLIWPAFGHPLPVKARKSDWQILFVWGSYIASIVFFGLFGSTFFSLIRSITGQEPWKFIRDNLLWTIVCFVAGAIFTAFRAGLQGSVWRNHHRPGGKARP